MHLLQVLNFGTTGNLILDDIFVKGLADNP